MGSIAVDEVDLTSVFRNEGTEDGPQGPGAVDGCSHITSA